MTDGPVLTTRRLLLRRWEQRDRAPFAALNADPEVMAHLPACLTRAESDALVDRIEAALDRDGFGLWAVEVAATGEFVGFTGLTPVPFDAHFTPAVEVGWRLDRQAWGHGYATEAAQASLAFAFDEIRLDEVVSMTVPINVRSRAVMRRIGMVHHPADDFDNPRLREGRLRRHVLYRMTADHWRGGVAGSTG